MFHGKVIYNPSGKAGEYSYWAANFYNGCSAKCEYCYNRKGIVAKVLGGDVPTLKKSLIDEKSAINIFCSEAFKNLDELRKHGLFFNFVSDPCLKETFALNFAAIRYCLTMAIPVKVLTKQTWWVDFLFSQDYQVTPLISFGFTLTDHDELEPGAATNAERIEAMKKLHDAGFKTWASIEPIIDFESSSKVIGETRGYCDLYKIGLQSGKKYDPYIARLFFSDISSFLYSDAKIYWKDSMIKLIGVDRCDLPANCVDRTFNL